MFRRLSGPVGSLSAPWHCSMRDLSGGGAGAVRSSQGGMLAFVPPFVHSLGVGIEAWSGDR